LGAFEEAILWSIWKSLEYVEGFKYYAVENKIHRDFRIKKIK
jgi:hypothetical protein